jgi:hypothetical protein
MGIEEHTPRMTVEITEDLQRRMVNTIPWGMRSKVMAILLEDVLDMVDLHGGIVLAAVINRGLGARDVVKEFRDIGGQSGTK